MSFLEPALLWALPAAALPVIIHLINQRRFQNIEWGAMRFLLEANRMSRGYARIRQWAILAARALAIAGLVFAITRPLASGWLGRAGGGKTDLTLILLDRSASMTAHGSGGGASKLATGVRQLAQTLSVVGSEKWALIDSVTQRPQELESLAALARIPQTSVASSSTDIPALLQAAHDYLRDNRPGQTDVWIVSDLRTHDWHAASGRWQTLRDGFQDFQQGVRFHLLVYPDATPGNASIRVTDVRRAPATEEATLLVSLAVHRDEDEGAKTVPVRIEIDGAGTETPVELIGSDGELRDHPIHLPPGREEGWGRVSIPADGDPADNEFYFVFAKSPPRRTLLVAEDPAAVRAIKLAATISPDGSTASEAAEATRSQLKSHAWEELALVVWQAPLPDQAERPLVDSFLDRGGSVIFLPPRQPNDEEFHGVAWEQWQTPDEPRTIDAWRGDQDLLARAASGAALPVGDVAIRRYCRQRGETSPLASLEGGETLLSRVASERGALYFLSTTSATTDSSLAGNGIVLYAMVQRAIAAGAVQLAAAQQLDAGARQEDSSEWQLVAGGGEALSTEFPHHAGVYRAGARTWAVNRSAGEDKPAVLGDEQLQGLFGNLEFDRIDDRAGSLASLTHEIWRVFLVGMLVALVTEAALSLPRKRAAPAAEERFA